MSEPMDFSFFMQAMTVAPYDDSKCLECGGSGLVPIGCCDGRECGCKGMEVDYLPCECGLPPPTNDQLIQWHKRYKR